MSELLFGGIVSASEMLKSCKSMQLPSGDVLYESSSYFAGSYRQLPDEPFKLLVSSEGQQLSNRKEFINLVDLSVIPPIDRKVFRGHHGFVTREEIKGFLGLERKAVVAVKRIYVQCLNRISGFTQFQAMKDLMEAGFYCATPLLATRDRFVSQWIDGVNATSEGTEQLKDSDFTSLLLNAARALKNSGRWPTKWKLDTFSNNFFIRNACATNLKDRYVIIDPIYV